MATENEIRQALYEVNDPELGMNIMDLGLVYRAEVTEENMAIVEFTLTYPGCPLGDVIYEDIEKAIKTKTDAETTDIRLVWNPPWDSNRMSENARLMMGYPI